MYACCLSHDDDSMPWVMVGTESIGIWQLSVCMQRCSIPTLMLSLSSHLLILTHNSLMWRSGGDRESERDSYVTVLKVTSMRQSCVSGWRDEAGGNPFFSLSFFWEPGSLFSPPFSCNHHSSCHGRETDRRDWRLKCSRISDPEHSNVPSECNRSTSDEKEKTFSSSLVPESTPTF